MTTLYLPQMQVTMVLPQRRGARWKDTGMTRIVLLVRVMDVAGDGLVAAGLQMDVAGDGLVAAEL